MGLPWENITGGAATVTLALTWVQNDWSRLLLLKHFTGLWTVGFVFWVVWAIWIYPLLVSPLRHLPEPSNNHWLLGQAKRIFAEPSGVPMREWFVNCLLWCNCTLKTTY